MRNERFAARQKLGDVYRAQLAAAQIRIEQQWKNTSAELEKLAATNSASAAFARCGAFGIVDGVVIFDEQGRIVYPNSPSVANSDFTELEPKWQEASRFEYLRKYVEAAKRYKELGHTATNENTAARAYQSEVRCRTQAGQNEAVIKLVNETFQGDCYRDAVDLQGRLIAANAESLALELITNRASPAFLSLARRLAARLTDYGNAAMAASQRRFLMKEVQRLSPEKIEFPTLPAEQVAAEVVENHLAPAGDSSLRRSVLPDLWQFTTPNRRVLALFRSTKILALATNSANSLADVKVTLVPPDMDATGALVTLGAGTQMPGWRLALSGRDSSFFEATAGHQTAIYLWTTIFVLAAMGVLTIVALRVVRRHMKLARLKNDLAATVSHELKTPLTSMRVLVETLLDAEKLDEGKTREYLQIISEENQRLGRLIQNFLTFSRMERKKHSFHFSSLRPCQIVDAAVESARKRFDGPGCRLEVQIENDLPLVMADADAVDTALSNLVENAYKYSREKKHIVLRARAENGHVIFSVADNGIGIARAERRRIFQPFYRVDERLSGNGGGCGLGLSIVQFVTTAHGGSVSVDSLPGCGSTFSISLPVGSNASSIRKEDIA